MTKGSISNGQTVFHPYNNMVSSWEFTDDKEAEACANIAERKGISVNILQHLFPAILRMLGENNSIWSK